MALIVKAQATPAGSEVISAVNSIRSGIAILQKLNGLRAEAIGVGDSAVTMASVFGVESQVQAQELNDRWETFLPAYNDSNNEEMTKLHVLIDAFTQYTG